MQYSGRQRFLSVFSGMIALSFSFSAHAQVLDNPTYIDLPLPFTPAVAFTEFPSTHNIGEIDPSVVSNVGAVPLNDLAILVNGALDPQDFNSGLGRIYVVTHTSGSDTQALSDPPTLVDIPLSASDPTCYFDATSVQILDLNADGINDLAFAGDNCFSPPAPITFSGDIGPGNIYGVQGIAGSPFFTAANVILGAQGPDASMPDPIDSDLSQPTLAAADFNNNGQIDLAFYNFNDSGPSDLIQVLNNNGSVGPLPSSANTVTGPFDPADDLGYNVIAGDFNGDGNQDIAMTFVNPNDAPNASRLVVYSGNGDGTFAPAPLVDESVGGTGLLHSLASGNFDGNGFSDFVTLETDDTTGTLSEVYIVTCSPGSPNPTCQVSEFDINPNTDNVGISAATADFNNDTFDDLVFSQVFDGNNTVDTQAQIHLNNGDGSFDSSPDQIFQLNLASSFPFNFIGQVLAQDIDACGGPDLSFIGFGFELPPPQPPIVFNSALLQSAIKQGAIFPEAQNQLGVAFNPNEAPIADAGPDNGTRVNNGIQLGGNPTCSDPTNDAMEISWTQISGQTATLNDPTAANPVITSASGTADAEFQVTCTDACGLSDTDTVTVDLGLIQGSGTCSLHVLTANSTSAAWLMLPATLGLLGALRRKKS